MKKKYFIMLLVVINIVVVLNVNAATNPYSESGSYGTNCTWYTWKMVNEKVGITLPGWGNAKNWYDDAKNSGYAVGTTPKSNSIVVWGNWTSYGHVGYVESVEDNVLHVWDSTGSCIDEEDEEFRECIANGVSEETDKICYANAKRIACEYTISPDLYGITGYIYLDNAPENPIPSTSQNSNTKVESTTTTTVAIKSNNAYLSDINIDVGIIDFNKEIFEYNIEVDNKIDKILINATSEDKNAVIKGLGEYELNIGLNEFKLIVIAEDDSTLEYVIKARRNEHLNDESHSNIINTKNEENINKKDNTLSIIIVLSILLLIFLIVCVVFIFNKKRRKIDKK